MGFRRIVTLSAALLAAVAVLAAPRARAQTGPAEGKEGLVELSKFDERLKGHYAPKGFKVQIIAAEPTIIDPTGMAFDDGGNLFVSEWKIADRMLFDYYDTIPLPEGGTARIQRLRKPTTDVVKKLVDTNGDGVYDAAQVVVDGAEMPASIFPWKNSLLLSCVGRLEQWTDTDNNGTFETKTVLANGFCGFYHHWLSGMTLNSDGWFYLTAGDNDNHVVGSDGSRVEISRCGGIFRGKVDGSKMNFFAMGFRNPYRDLSFNSRFDPFHVDNDQEEGSKFQGVRFINPVEGGDYGWRLRAGASCCQTDFDRGAVNGELPGKLPYIAKTGRGAPAGMIVYNGTAFPEQYRDMVIYPDVFRKSVRGYRVAPKGGSYELKEVVTLMTADDDLFRPCNAVVGADGAIYVVDWRSNSGGAGRLWGDTKFGRIYKLTWEGDGETAALPTKPNHWGRVINASDADLLALMKSKDLGEARRAQREFVARGDKNLPALLALMNDRTAEPHARLLGLQGARQFWRPQVEAAMVAALDDPSADIRRLAAQSISWETAADPKFLPVLIRHLNDKDDRALRDVALAIGTHGTKDTETARRHLNFWLMTNTTRDVATRDAFIRALERLGPAGPGGIAEIITAGGKEQEDAVAVFTAFRTADAAKLLPTLATLPNVQDPQRAALIRQFKDIPMNIPVATQPLVDWMTANVAKVGPASKVAALDVCRLLGNPAPALVTTLLDDPDETVRLFATRLAAESRPAGAMEKLAARVADARRSVAERTAIARTLRVAGPSAYPGLEAAFKAFPDDAAFRKTVLRSMADADRAHANAIAADLAADANAPGELRAEALGILAETPQTALNLGQLFLDGKLTRSDLPTVLVAIRRYQSPEHVELLAKIEEAVAKGMAALSIDDLKARVHKGADPWNGLAIFLREQGARCYACHKVENYGGQVGPALTGVYQALSLDKMIESMLQPSKEIKEGYESYKVATKDGRVLNGIKVAQDANALVLRDANGQETRIPTAEIDEQGKEGVSLMPVGLVYDLSPGELSDLLSFLLSKPAQDTLKNRQRLDHWVAVGPFAPGGDESHVPLDRIEATKSFPGQEGRPVTWVPLETSSRGNLNLRGQFGLNPGQAYLATNIRSDAAQDAALRYALDGAARVYLNGKKVAESGPQSRIEPNGPAALTHLELKPGWNTLIIAMDRPAGGEGQAIVEIGTSTPVEVSPVTK